MRASTSGLIWWGQDPAPSAGVNAAGQTPAGIPAQPAVEGLAGHADPLRHRGDRRPFVEDLQHGEITLLHEPELHQHDPDLPRPTTMTS
jgi:hypothetical protein